MRRLAVALAACAMLLGSAAHAATDADPKLLDEIEALIDRASTRGLDAGEMNRLHSMIVRAEDQVRASWSAATLDEINTSRTGRLWKKGNGAILKEMQRKSAAGTGTLGFLPSGKGFEDPAFDPRSSDYDATVLGARSGEGAEKFTKAAPGDFLERRKFTVMSGDGNFYRYRGGADTAYQAMSAGQVEAARQKTIRQMAGAADAGGGYLSRGAVAGLEAQIREGKYGGQVTFFDGGGRPLGRMHVSRLGSLAERFGVVEAHYGDVLGMASDNHAQLANYLAQKGAVGGSAKVLQRQSKVIEQLSEDLRRGLTGDASVAKALKDADALADALKKGVSADEALKKLGLTAEDFTRQADAISRRVMQAAGADLARSAGAVADPAARTGARLMLEQNVLSAIVNAGGIEQFRAQHAGNRALLALADGVEKGYGAGTVAGLAERRAKAIAAGVEGAARSAGIPEKALANMLDTAADAGKSTAKAASRTARGAMAALVSGVGIDAAYAAYYLANGNYMDAANSLIEGGITYAMPAAAIALLAKDLTRLGMQFAVDHYTSGYRDKRLEQTWAHVRDVVAAEHFDEFAKELGSAVTWQDLMPYAELLLQESGGLVRLHGLESETQALLAQQLFEMRHRVMDQYLASRYFEQYLEARMKNQAWEREREDEIARDVLASLEHDKAERRPAPRDKEKEKEEETEKDRKEAEKPKTAEREPKKKRAWDEPRQEALVPAPPAGEKPARRRAWDEPEAQERARKGAPPQSAPPAPPVTGRVVPWAEATPRSVCLAYQGLLLRKPVHDRLKNVTNVRATGEPRVTADGRCALSLTGQWYEYPDGRTIRVIGDLGIAVPVDQARRTLERHEPASGTVSAPAPPPAPAQPPKAVSAPLDDTAACELYQRNYLKWFPLAVLALDVKKGRAAVVDGRCVMTFPQVVSTAESVAPGTAKPPRVIEVPMARVRQRLAEGG